MAQYYDGTKLLNMTDVDGNKPEILLCTTNRTGGKTTYFNRYLINRFIRHKEKFCLLYRYQYELDDVCDKFFKDIQSLFFNGHDMTQKKLAKGLIRELFLDGESCGYAISLNGADGIKKYSHLLSDVVRILMDEFQSEQNKYVSDEIRKFVSIHTSIARGHGEQVRFVQTIMLSNTVTIINPYYIALGISARLTSDTKFLKGHGFVLEQGFVDSASNAQKASGFNKAMSGSDYVAYSSEAVYLNDNSAFIEKPEGFSRYLCTIKYKGVDYAVRQYPTCLYCDDKPDMSFPRKIAITTDDHNISYVLMSRGDSTLLNFRYFYNHGAWRFKNLLCKEAILTALSCSK